MSPETDAGILPFHPLIRDWFLRAKGAPTDVQAEAWPRIAAGEHILVTAPTGSGKTLTAFLWALNQLATGAWSRGQVRVLYVSPLKALNNDIRENLLSPLAQIRESFERAGENFPGIRVLTRSGDTPQGERRKMYRHPPEILITTPESLNLLISSTSGCLILGGIKTVVLDEVHACAGSKRGVHLITAVDRLVRLSGEFQRIALSATLENPRAVARMVGGYELSGPALATDYAPRPVACIASDIQKQYQMKICFPRRPLEEDQEMDFSVWDLLADAFLERIEKNRATLLFTNGRRLCEKLAYKINNAAGRLVAFAHHGSLSRELRTDVEEKLRSGGLKAIVATSSLEMGIDIGELDEVIMVQSPFAVSSAVQRLGRAGHRVGMESCGRLYPAHAQDLIPSAVLARAVAQGDIEPLAPVDAPLDVLAQILISMTAMDTWDVDELFSFIRSSAPYHRLDRVRFDLVLNMLAGYYGETRIRELRPRVSIDRLDNRVAARKGALLSLYMSGGTIPDRGYYKLRHAETRVRIGELDEEYVWEAKVGQIATVGSQNWKITRITHDDVFALPAGHRGMDAPFWLAEGLDRDYHFSRRIGRFLEDIDTALAGGKGPVAALGGTLVRDYAMDDASAGELVRFCRSQARAAAIPHRRRIVLEYVRSGPGAAPGTMLVIHTLWGGRVNRPFALALEAAWTQHFGERPEIFPGNDAVIIQLPGPVDPDTLFSLVTRENLESMVMKQLESSGFFAARFRECAGRALLVTRHRINQRMPLWMTRLQAQKLMENVVKYPDFPILLETWRTCIKDEFDMAALGQVLEELAEGQINWAVVHTSRPSPFAAAMAWNQINQYMYREDQPASARSSLTDELIKGLIFDEGLRPVLPQNILEAFELKRQRLAPGYAPATPADLLDWVKDRVAIPEKEWQLLEAGLEKEIGAHEAAALMAAVRDKLDRIPGGGGDLVTAREKTGDIRSAWYGPRIGVNGDPAFGIALFSQWISFYGPVSPAFCTRVLGLDHGRLDLFISSLSETKDLVTGRLAEEGGDADICDAKNFETLVRMQRKASRPGDEPLEIGRLPFFLAQTQGLVGSNGGRDRLDSLFSTLEQLACLPLPAGLWEREILPARVKGYHPSFLDSVFQEGELRWMGHEKEQVLFCFDPDLVFFEPEEGAASWDGVFTSPEQRFDFSTLKSLTQQPAPELAADLWKAVWKGRLSSDNFLALRRGILNKFKLPRDPSGAARKGSRHSRHRGLRRFRPRAGGQADMAGFWFRPEGLGAPAGDGDLVDREELNREKARLLLDRYGILFRELAAREAPGFRWGDLFKSLYLMELSGEVVAGSFFKGIEGPQFMSPGAFRRLKAGPDRTAVFWMNGMDPASPCGLGPAVRRLKLPRRLASTHLVYRGNDLVLVSLRSGRELAVHVPPEDPGLAGYLAPLRHLLTRPFDPLPRVTIETINGGPAAASPYKHIFQVEFEVDAGPRTLDLFQRRDHEPPK
ncbi:MAG: DEAD/DEAH box helicase [Desulfobacter sp.]|nr:MAG: DEAD/DEAH box helicase [Desulfobacter sp.]